MASGGKASSTSFIRGTGLKTWRPTNRSGEPLAAASSAIDSDEVVVASTASAPACGHQLAELGQHRGLVAVVLDHGLDQERRGAAARRDR